VGCSGHNGWGTIHQDVVSAMGGGTIDWGAIDATGREAVGMMGGGP
jgi:hypothetical protein